MGEKKTKPYSGANVWNTFSLNQVVFKKKNTSIVIFGCAFSDKKFSFRTGQTANHEQREEQSLEFQFEFTIAKSNFL